MPDEHRAAPRKIPFLVRLLFVAAILFTTLGVVETAFIGVDWLRGGAFSVQRAPDLGLGVRSWTEHHAQRPGFREPNFHTNSFGLRSPEVAVPKPSGTFRVLLLGDSFTFGFRVREDENFARRLERRLRTAYGETAEVVNAGVISYAPLLEYLQYRNHLHVLEPDLVILNFDMSDVQDHMIYARDTTWSGDGVPLFVTERSLGQSASAMPALLSFQWVARSLAAMRRRVESRSQGVPFVQDRDRYLWALDNGGEWDKEVGEALAPIGHLSTLLRHHAVPFILATYPQPWQVSAEATSLPPIRDQYGIGMHTVHLNDRSFRKLAKFAAERDIPFLNATQVFRDAPQPATLFLDDDFHFSVRGNQLYADELANYVAAHGLAPKALR